MKTSIKLTLIALAALASPMLRAMEERRSLADAIMQDNVATIKWFIEEKKLDPFEPLMGQPGYNPEEMRKYQDDSLFEIVLMKVNAPNIFQFLLQPVENWLIEISLPYALTNGPIYAKNLLWDEAKKRNLDTQKILNKALESAVIEAKPKAVRLLLAQGADRYGCFRINRQLPIETAKNELEKAQKQRETQQTVLEGDREFKIDEVRLTNKIDSLRQTIRILRTDALNLKTHAALKILNQVRKGKLTIEDFQKKQLPQDLIDLLTAFAQLDREALPEWKKIADQLMSEQEKNKP